MPNIIKSAVLTLPLALALSGCLNHGSSGDEEPNLQGRFLLGTTAKAVQDSCDQALKNAANQLAAIRAIPLATADKAGLLVRWNEVNQLLDSTTGTADLQANTDTRQDLRDAALACTEKVSSQYTDMYQDEVLYQRMNAVLPADELDTLAKRDILKGFESSGISLDAAKRAQFKQLSDDMTTLANEFNANVANDGKIIVTLSPAETAGIDAAFLATIPKDTAGNYPFKLNYPNRDNIMGYASNEEARRKFYVAFMQRGGNRNITILDELSKKRRQQAQLLGKESFAAWTLEDRMAGTPKAVDDFLASVGSKVEALEKKEIADLTTLKRSDTANPAAKLERWDVTYYQTKVKKQNYALDQAEVRKQFPTQGSVDWLLLVSSRLYGLTFKANAKLPVWHPDVKAYDVYEADGKTYIGSFYMDLFPRDDKYGHAAAWGVRGVSTQLNAKPVSVLVTNFDKGGLSSDELETLFHEFGHVLHGVLSKTRYSFHAGTNVKRDFVEAPSQMFEEWTRRPEVTRLLTEACASCKPVDAALIAKIKAANNYGAGIQYARQRLYASYDMSLVGKDYQAPLASWQALEGATPLGYVPATLFPAGFGHLAGGYAAGYYGYMWSEVMALDMQSAYGSNFMDPKVGAKYRSLILEKGGEVNPMTLVTQFLGRAPNSDAFFAQITGTRQ